MDLWQLNERDHRNIAHLIHETPNALNGPGVVRSRERLLGDLIDQLETHAAALEASLYDRLSHETESRHLVEELRREQREFMQQLNILTRYRQKGSAGWLDAFGDATFLVDQHLHRHTHELIPAAREHFSAEELRDATRIFVRAKMGVLRTRQRGTMARLVSSEFVPVAAICAAVAGIGLIAWRTGLFRGLGARWQSPKRSGDGSRGQARGAQAFPPVRGASAISNDPSQQDGESVYSAMFLRVSGQDQGASAQSGDGIETLVSDVLYKVDQPSVTLRTLVLPALQEANAAWAGHGFQVYLQDQTLTERHDQPSGKPRVLFRVAKATLPEDLVAEKAHLFVFESADAEGELHFGIRAPGTTEDVQSFSHNSNLRSGGELTAQTLQEIFERALRLALSGPL